MLRIAYHESSNFTSYNPYDILASMQPRIGIYSGTFDPIHQGHLAFAQKAQEVCGLDRVVFIPDPQPRAKQAVTALNHRLSLIATAIGSLPGLESLTLTTPQFTVKETLPEIQTRFPNTNITLLLGSDVVQTFSYRWDGLQTLFRQTHLAIGMRAHDDQQTIVKLLSDMEALYNTPIRYTLVHAEHNDISSSQLRKNGAV